MIGAEVDIEFENEVDWRSKEFTSSSRRGSGYARKSIRAELQERFPGGAIVEGPFDMRGLVYHVGVGQVDWSIRTSHRYVPVDVIEGKRMSGGYLPSELTVVESDLIVIG